MEVLFSSNSDIFLLTKECILYMINRNDYELEVLEDGCKNSNLYT